MNFHFTSKFYASWFATLLVAAICSVILTPPAAAQGNSASHCIRVGESKDSKSRTLTNTCSTEVMVFWCHHGDAKGTRDSACDRAKLFYTQQTLLKPLEVKSNRFSLPLSADVTFGACRGSYGSFSLLDNTSSYYCHPDRIGPAGKTETLVHTSQGHKPAEELCAEATAMAKEYGVASECACETFQSFATCKVQSNGKGAKFPGFINGLKTFIRENLKCDPVADENCKPTPSRNIAIGVRG